MGRTTSIIISTNRSTKTYQKQTIWFGDGEIRLNGETGTYIGKYAKNGKWYNAEVYFGGEVQELSQPTATQAAEAVAWAWLACKALEGFAAAAAYVLDGIEREESARIEQAQYDYKYAQEAEREAAAEATWQECRAKGGWLYIFTANTNLLVFNAAEERALNTTLDGEVYREVEAKSEVWYALTEWGMPTIHPYTGEVWAHYFRATFAHCAHSNMGIFSENVELFRKAVAFDELETPEQVSAWLFIHEAATAADIPEWATDVEFRWRLSFRKHAADFCNFFADEGEAHLYYKNSRARREEQRTIIADCK
jgi:hypothetical protein